MSKPSFDGIFRIHAMSILNLIAFCACWPLSFFLWPKFPILSVVFFIIGLRDLMLVLDKFLFFYHLDKEAKKSKELV